MNETSLGTESGEAAKESSDSAKKLPTFPHLVEGQHYGTGVSVAALVALARPQMGGYIWRGEASWHEQILPRIDRATVVGAEFVDPSNLRMRMDAEVRSIERFKSHAWTWMRPEERYICGGERPETNELGVLTLMQHYGAPTRLLDWTESAFVALYFTCAGSPDKDGYVYGFHEGVVRAAQEEVRKDLRRGGQKRSQMSALSRALYAWEDEQYHEEVNLLEWKGIQFPRLSAQQGKFTIANQPGLDHLEVAKKMVDKLDAETIGRYCGQERPFVLREIKAEAKRDVLIALREMGLSAEVLFPGMEGVAQRQAEIMKTVVLKS